MAILWLFGILSMADIPGIPTLTIPLWLQWAMVVSIGFLKALAWTALLILCRRNVFARCVAVGLIVVFALLSIANVTSYMLYGFGVSYKLMVVLAQTNAGEVAGFLPGLVANLLRTRTLLLSLAAVGLIALTAWAVRLLSRRAWLWVCGVMCMLGFGGGVWMVTCRTLSKSVISVYGRTAKYSIKIYRDNRKCRDLIHAGTPFPNPELITTDGKPLSVVMIIGESASRDALSIYGFPLATTPEFDAMHDSLAVFTDAIGASSLTALNMERLLTFKRDTDEDAHWNTFPRLLDMMNKAGFKTFWFDSQEREGKWSDCSGMISSEADVVRYTCAQSSEEHSRHKYDTDLLPLFAKALADTAANKFVVLHLIGSHTNYADPLSSGVQPLQCRFRAPPGAKALAHTRHSSGGSRVRQFHPLHRCYFRRHHPRCSPRFPPRPRGLFLRSRRKCLHRPRLPRPRPEVCPRALHHLCQCLLPCRPSTGDAGHLHRPPSPILHCQHPLHHHDPQRHKSPYLRPIHRSPIHLLPSPPPLRQRLPL